MKNLKKITALMLVLAMIFSFSACGSGNDTDNGSAEPSGQSQEADEENQAEEQNSGSDNQDQQNENGSGEENGAQDQSKAPENESKDPESADSKTDDKSGKNSDSIPVNPSELKGEYSGSFASDTETAINLVTKWAANSKGDGTYEVKFQFFLDCYSIQVGERTGNKLKIKAPSGDKELTFKSPMIVKEKPEKGEIFVGDAIVDLTKEDLEAGVDVTAVYDFKGSYSDKELPEITAEGKVKAE